MRGRSFLWGALILVAGSLASRALGAVYRFILPCLMGCGPHGQGAVGMGLFGMAYPIYTVVLNLSVVGIPLAISKLVSEHVARGDRPAAMRVFRVAFGALVVFGFACSILLVLIAGPYARLEREPRVTVSVLAIAPAVFFVSLETAYRGFFQGLQHMTPQAVSSVVEQIARIGTMFLLATLLLHYGIQYAAAGATFGAVTGGVAGLVYLIWRFRTDPVAAAIRRIRPAPLPLGPVLRRIIALAVPISLTGIVLPLMNLMDAAVVPTRLYAAGLGAQATALFGVLTGFATPFVIAPTILTAALSISVLPAISEALARGELEAVKARVVSGLRVTLMVLVPAAIGLVLLGKDLPLAWMHSARAGVPLMVLAPAALFIGLQQVTSGMLQGLGFPGIPVRNLALGGVVKLVLTWVLVADRPVNIAGAALGTTVAFVIASALNVAEVRKRVGRLGFGRMAMRPLFAAVPMSGVVVLVMLVMRHHLRPGTLCAVACGVLVYGAALLAVGGLRQRDLELLPRVGGPLTRVLMRLRLLRA